MMNKETYLFVGGERDGERREMPSPAPSTMACLRHPKAKAFSADGQGTDKMLTADNVEVYHLNTLSGNSECFRVYMLEGMNGNDLVGNLIHGYKPQDDRLAALKKARKALVMMLPEKDGQRDIPEVNKAFSEALGAIYTVFRNEELKNFGRI